MGDSMQSESAQPESTQSESTLAESTESECNVCLDRKECFQLPCGRCPPACMSCIEVLAEDLIDETLGDEATQLPEDVRTNRYGTCHICKKHFVKNGTDLSRPVGRCYMCGHHGMVLGAIKYCQLRGEELMLSGLCDNCWLCEAYPETYKFEYECNRCGRFQTIPHPMYRYQPAPDAFPPTGGPTWACHRGCGDYTNWRIRSDQVSSVPVADKPESWNQLESTQPESTLSESTLPEGTQLESTLPEGTQSESTLPEGTQSESTLPEGTQSECNVCLDMKECFQLPCGRCPPACMSCIEVLAEDLIDETLGDEATQLPEDVRTNRYGTCHICKKHFVKNGTDLSRPVGRCYMCGHLGMVLAAIKYCQLRGEELMLGGLCDNCWLCEAYPETYEFEYECNRCGRFQTIPHPMYRYQPAPDAFPPTGGPTWACHQGCGDYTNWRIRSDQASSVPVADKPESWN